ncbi:hypothetical protein T265_05497 [Opisthorchis viverrini]|uniref:Ig-like domain-containing protein n=1 Tax=Opisthorchis viverrini TaxID=6198 RepID=A0A074ZVQ2_OPIVI|nr:hypothetical protein T265_05497 [Opisthorchis viverrini]KER27460.1 hypothetical protein T265_05497 [Opisthorchis viverrini]
MPFQGTSGCVPKLRRNVTFRDVSKSVHLALFSGRNYIMGVDITFDALFSYCGVKPVFSVGADIAWPTRRQTSESPSLTSRVATYGSVGAKSNFQPPNMVGCWLNVLLLLGLWQTEAQFLHSIHGILRPAQPAVVRRWTVFTGKRVVLNCSVELPLEINPQQVQYRWERPEGTPIGYSKLYVIPNVSLSDGGLYVCHSSAFLGFSGEQWSQKHRLLLDVSTLTKMHSGVAAEIVLRLVQLIEIHRSPVCRPTAGKTAMPTAEQINSQSCHSSRVHAALGWTGLIGPIEALCTKFKKITPSCQPNNRIYNKAHILFKNPTAIPVNDDFVPTRAKENICTKK